MSGKVRKGNEPYYSPSIPFLFLLATAHSIATII